MPLERRALLHALAAAPALAPFLALERAMAATPPPKAPATLDDARIQAAEAHHKFMEVPNLRMHGGETVSMLLYPGFTALDLVGPHYFFASMMGSKVELVTNQPTLAPVASDLGLAIQPTATLNTAFARPTVLFVPGGSLGTVAAMEHEPTLDYLVERAADARLITSVCTGSLVLGAAGLL
jgi:putative intracellular protease/amidase